MYKDHGSVMVVTWGYSFVMLPTVELYFAKAQMGFDLK